MIPRMPEPRAYIVGRGIAKAGTDHSSATEREGAERRASLERQPKTSELTESFAAFGRVFRMRTPCLWARASLQKQSCGRMVG